MFNGISSFFNNLTVGRKLATGFGALVLLTLLVGATSFAATAFQRNALNTLLAAEENYQLGQGIEISILEARRREDFLLRWQEEGFEAAYASYIELNQQHVQDVLALSSQMAAENTDEDEIALLTQVNEAAAGYGENILSMTTTLQERGFVDTGLEGSFRELVHALEEAIGSDPEITVIMLQMRRHEKDYLLRGDLADVDETAAYTEQLKAAIRAHDGFSSAKKDELVALADAYLRDFQTLVQKDADVAVTIEAMRAQAQAVEPLVVEMNSLQQAKRDTALSAYQAVEQVARVIQLVLIVLSIATGTGLALLIARQITRQVDEIQTLFRAVAVGEFERRATVFSKDELGQTADAINAMLRQMLSILEDTETERASLDAALGTLVATAGSADVAEQAAESANQGSRAVADTIMAMGRIRDNTQETARRIKRLGEASKEISEVVRLIEEVADRTTVLALNASIQAAAAGDAGRGFAVVAEEVQRLAERATGEARRIENLVKSIQAETNEAVVGVDEATREVVEGTRLAQQAGEQVSKLNGLVNELANLIQGVAESTNLQTSEAWNTGAVKAIAGNGNGHSRN